MLRVVRKRSVVSKLCAVHYGFKLAVVDRGPLFGGGCLDRFDCSCFNSKHSIRNSQMRKANNGTLISIMFQYLKSDKK
jgi:hypothetical protein